MPDSGRSSEARRPPEDFGHPRGTLVIVIIFAALFTIGWLAMYFYAFLARGAPHP